MAFYIVQHGLSLPKDRDPEQGLSPEGIEEVKRIAGVAKNYGVKVERILHSTKKRARQTAELIAGVLEPAGGIEEITGIKPMDNVAAFAARVDLSTDTMVVGHLPFLAKLVSHLVVEDESRAIAAYSPGSIVCLQRENATHWQIDWMIRPELLR